MSYISLYLASSGYFSYPENSWNTFSTRFQNVSFLRWSYFRYFIKCQEIHIFLNLPHSPSFGYKLLIWWIPKQNKSIGDRSGDLGVQEMLKSLGPPAASTDPSIRYNWQLIIEPAPHYLWPMGRYKQIKGIIHRLKAL